MGARYLCARALAAFTAWGLKSIFRRPAGNFPGKIALYLDPQLIRHAATKISEGSIIVVGTNGKTTVNNLLADTFEAAGKSVICNRAGANLSSGIATALLQSRPAEVGVFESDELWLARVTPQLKPRYVLLLNLFRDQLDRVGEIDRIQNSIVGALESSPQTTLIYNADDPLCAAIATRISNPTLAFGVEGDMGLSQNTVADAQMCQQCSSMMEYRYRQYGQLGEYHCPCCGFARPARDWTAEAVRLDAEGLRFTLRDQSQKLKPFEIRAGFSGAYMVYNLLALATGACLCGLDPQTIQQAIDAFNPQNGRLQRFEINGRYILLNLAKNPTGFNQNIKIILQDTGPKTVAFFINDKEADGHDVSWLWDIDFEELAGQKNLHAFAGGIRAKDMQVRLKYAGIDAQLVQNATGLLSESAKDERGSRVYLIANYTALPALRAELTRLNETPSAIPASPSPAEQREAVSEAAQKEGPDRSESSTQKAAPLQKEASPSKESLHKTKASPQKAPALLSEEQEAPLVITHLFPDLMNLYGDGGNVGVMAYRAQKRGIACEVRRVEYGDSLDAATSDIIFLGGGPDREQRLASQELLLMKDALSQFVEEGGAFLGICGGYQILGKEWLLGEEVQEGLGIIDIVTRRAPGGSINRLVGNIVLKSSLAKHYVVGYENHAGRTYLGADMEPFGTVVSNTGCGNNEADKADGVRYRNLVGTYLHGPLLCKNPEIADWFLLRGLERRSLRLKLASPKLSPLKDDEEYVANKELCKRFGLG